MTDLTDERKAALPTDLRAKLAELCGLRFERFHPYAISVPVYMKRDEAEQCEVMHCMVQEWQPERNIAQIFMCVEAMRTRGYTTILAIPHDERAFAGVRKQGSGYTYESADTMPAAIALAIYRALEAEESADV